VTISENGSMLGGESANGPIGLAENGSFFYRDLDPGQRKAIHAAGRKFASLAGGAPCLLLIGRLTGLGDPGMPSERRVQLACEERFGYPKSPPEATINVILDSTGGPLDSAFRTVLFLSRYAERLNVYVPRKAKSASTLIAVGANTIYMSPFSELGPLDTQIRDPRNPTDYISALDCYQSVDYVREFGFSTLSQALNEVRERALHRLAEEAHQIGADAVVDLADEQAIDAGLAAAAPGGYDVIVDFLWGGVAPHAMNHARPGARYIQVGNSAGAASTITGLVLRNKLLTLVGHSLFATPAEVRRSAYAQLAGHAIDGKLTMDMEQTRLADISGTWEHLKAGASRKLVVTP